MQNETMNMQNENATAQQNAAPARTVSRKILAELFRLPRNKIDEFSVKLGIPCRQVRTANADRGGIPPKLYSPKEFAEYATTFAADPAFGIRGDTAAMLAEFEDFLKASPEEQAERLAAAVRAAECRRVPAEEPFRAALSAGEKTSVNTAAAFPRKRQECRFSQESEEDSLPLLSANEIAALFCVSVTTIRELAEQFRTPFVNAPGGNGLKKLFDATQFFRRAEARFRRREIVKSRAAVCILNKCRELNALPPERLRATLAAAGAKYVRRSLLAAGTGDGQTTTTDNGKMTTDNFERDGKQVTGDGMRDEGLELRGESLKGNASQLSDVNCQLSAEKPEARSSELQVPGDGEAAAGNLKELLVRVPASLAENVSRRFGAELGETLMTACAVSAVVKFALGCR